MAKQSPQEKAGVVAYRPGAGEEPLVLVVSARKFENQWIFPVGTVEKGESLEAAARRECGEESGYLVDIGLRLAAMEIADKGGTKRFTFFLATPKGEVDLWETDRQRKWLPLSDLTAALPEVFRAVAEKAVAILSNPLRPAP